MKKHFLLLIFIGATRLLAAQDSLNVTRLGSWDDDALPLAFAYDLQYNGCWGLALDDREYAVLGGAGHVLFFDVTEPTQPQLIGKFAGTTNNTLWREFKSYKNRIYAVSDQTTEGLMIFDMSSAPDTVYRTYWSSEFFSSAHTITLDTVSGRIYLNGSNVNTMVVLDISQNPDQPALLSSVALPGGYIHDSYVRNDTLYASSGFNGYYIYDFTDPIAPKTLAALSGTGYNHNSWLNSAGTHAYFTEEIPDGQSVKIVDLQQLANSEIEMVGEFLDPLLSNVQGAPIPHNIYIKDNLLFNSQYEDGLLIYDISVPTGPVLMGYYDTHPQNTFYNKYHGNWGNYPWLPSGTIIAGDMQNGLQLLKYTGPQVGTDAPGHAPEVSLSPNPASEWLHIRVSSDNWTWRLFSATGRLLFSGRANGEKTQTLPLNDCSKGLYFIEIQTNEGQKALRKVVIH